MHENGPMSPWLPQMVPKEGQLASRRGTPAATLPFAEAANATVAVDLSRPGGGRLVFPGYGRWKEHAPASEQELVMRDRCKQSISTTLTEQREVVTQMFKALSPNYLITEDLRDMNPHTHEILVSIKDKIFAIIYELKSPDVAAYLDRVNMVNEILREIMQYIDEKAWLLLGLPPIDKALQRETVSQTHTMFHLAWLIESELYLEASAFLRCNEKQHDGPAVSAYRQQRVA